MTVNQQPFTHSASLSSDERGRIRQLDGLRALAFFSVAYSHWLPNRYQFGLPFGMGVQLFFVLSGFLITGILLDYRQIVERSRDLSIGHAFRVFYIRRILRIWPLFYVTIAITALWGIEPIRQTWPWHVSYLSNFYYYLGFLDPYRHFWTLAVEEQFYLIWPALILLLPRTKIPRVTVMLVILAPIFRLVAASDSGQRVNYLPFSCLDSLGAGALLAYAMRHPGEFAWLSKNSRSPVIKLGWVCGVATVLLLWTSGSRSIWGVDVGHTLVVLFFAWVVYRCAIGSTGFLAPLLNFPLLIFLGQISYGLYVFHNFFTGLQFRPLLRYLNLPEYWADVLAVRLLVQMSLTLVLTLVSWYYLEKPINGMKRYFQLGDEIERRRAETPRRSYAESGATLFGSAVQDGSEGQ